MDRPALRPLPATRYEFATWHKARVNIDYHIVADKHYYSVPYQLVRQQVDVRLSAATVEIFRHSRRVASHARSHVRHGHTTDPAHMPEVPPAARRVDPGADHRMGRQDRARHRRAGGRRSWRPGRIPSRATAPRWASSAWPAATAPTGPRPPAPAPCALRSYSYRSVESILRTGLDRQPLPGDAPALAPHPAHDNVRGPGYYH